MQVASYLSDACIPQPECTGVGDIVRVTGAQTQHKVCGEDLNSDYSEGNQF